MQSAGSIRSPAVVDAFLKTDRGVFLEHEDGQPSELEEGSAYIDSPMRHGILHLSAPSIYGVSLEVRTPAAASLEVPYPTPQAEP